MYLSNKVIIYSDRSNLESRIAPKSTVSEFHLISSMGHGIDNYKLCSSQFLWEMHSIELKFEHLEHNAS